MTTERKLIMWNFVLLYVFVFFTWIGWESFHRFDTCETQAQDIERTADAQDSLLYSVFLFEESMKAEKRLASKKVLENREPRLQQAIEIYAGDCRRAAHKARLSFMLKGYGLYLQTKQAVYEDSEAAGFDWIRKTLPPDPRFE